MISFLSGVGFAVHPETSDAAPVVSELEPRQHRPHGMQSTACRFVMQAGHHWISLL
jgi:hypothetical protein